MNINKDAFALSGRLFTANLPRALPWADISLAFQAVNDGNFNLTSKNIERRSIT